MKFALMTFAFACGFALAQPPSPDNLIAGIYQEISDSHYMVILAAANNNFVVFDPCDFHLSDNVNVAKVQCSNKKMTQVLSHQRDNMGGLHIRTMGGEETVLRRSALPLKSVVIH